MLSCHALGFYSITCTKILLWKSQFFHYRTVMFCQTSLSKLPTCSVTAFTVEFFGGLSSIHSETNITEKTALFLQGHCCFYPPSLLSCTEPKQLSATQCRRFVLKVLSTRAWCLSPVCTSSQLLTSRTLKATLCLEMSYSACPHFFWQFSSLITICLEEHYLK